MSKPDLTTRTRLAMGELLDRVLSGIAPGHPATPARALDLSELEERILLSASPVMVVAEMADAALTESTVVDGATSEALAPASSQAPFSSDEQSGSSVATNPSQVVTRELVFLDTSVEDYQQLLNDLWANDDSSRDIEVVLLSSSRDGIDQISEALASRRDLDAIHIVSHGTDASVKLGSTWLTRDNLAGYVGEIARWGDSLTADADLLFYGCDLAGSSDGQDLIDSLAALTGADVAASDDDTGHAIFGADWDLEYATGQIEAQIAFSQATQDNWGHVMNVAVDATSTGTTTGSTLSISHTTTSANDRLILVGVSIGEDSPPSVSSVTYNGSGLTSEGFVQSADGGTVEIFSLVAPTSGTHDVVVTLSGNGDANVGVMTFSGVDQATPLGTFGSATGDDTSGSATIGSATGELVFGVVTVNTSINENLLPGAGQTETWDLFSGFESNGGGSTEAGAASVNLSWSWTDSTGWAIGGISIRPSSISTITVNTTSDVLDGDADTSSLAALIATPGSDGFISLREALAATNNQSGTDTIEFNIAGAGVHTINLLSELDGITDTVIIDGWSEPDYSTTPVIELNGASAGVSADGLRLSAGGAGSTIRGLMINRFGDDGIDINVGSDGNTIVGNWIGIGADGVTDLGNSSDGIEIGSANNIIGGTTAAERNVISGNDSEGITIDTVTATGNFVTGNYIGTNAAGTAGVGNSTVGIVIQGGAAGNTIGGTTAGHRNVISGNLSDGVVIDELGTSGNVVIGNYIGTNAAGTLDLGNLGDGVKIQGGASSNRIGGTTAAERNVISGNDDEGIQISDTGSDNNLIQGNYIGLNAAGSATIGNTQEGVLVNNAATGTIIGGTDPGARNVISGNLKNGIALEGAGTTGTVIAGNYIGTDATGLVDLGNADDGIQIKLGAAGNLIGGTTTAARNIISGNDDDGVQFNGLGTSDNIVQGNWIGLSADGSSLGNLGDGVQIYDQASGNLIGGTSSGSGNVISSCLFCAQREV